jgi:RNA polymerase sigma factor (sigma-70 family)
VRDAHNQVAATFSAWLRDYGGIPVKIARSFASNPEDQRDLLQEMYLQLWRSIESFAAQAKASTWTYRVCLNTAMTWQRTEKRRHRFLNSADLADLYVPPRRLRQRDITGRALQFDSRTASRRSRPHSSLP